MELPEFLELRRDVPEYREADGVPLSVLNSPQIVG